MKQVEREMEENLLWKNGFKGLWVIKKTYLMLNQGNCWGWDVNKDIEYLIFKAREPKILENKLP